MDPFCIAVIHLVISLTIGGVLIGLGVGMFVADAASKKWRQQIQEIETMAEERIAQYSEISFLATKQHNGLVVDLYDARRSQARMHRRAQRAESIIAKFLKLPQVVAWELRRMTRHRVNDAGFLEGDREGDLVRVEDLESLLGVDITLPEEVTLEVSEWRQALERLEGLAVDKNVSVESADVLLCRDFSELEEFRRAVLTKKGEARIPECLLRTFLAVNGDRLRWMDGELLLIAANPHECASVMHIEQVLGAIDAAGAVRLVARSSSSGESAQ